MIATRIKQIVLLLAAGFTLAVMLKAVYEVGQALFNTHSYWVATLPVVLIFGACAVGWLISAVVHFYKDCKWEYLKRIHLRNMQTRMMLAGVYDRNVQ